MQRKGLPAAEACRGWLAERVRSGIQVLVPEIADYEVRRELIRLGHVQALQRLDAFILAVPGRYLGITTIAMKRAAELWAEARRQGVPTADPKVLDGDVILAAQALTSGHAIADIAVASSNPIHIRRFIASDLWANL